MARNQVWTTYPIDFVEIVGLEHNGAHDAGAWSGTKFDFHISEEDVEVCRDRRSVGLGVDGEGGTEIGICDGRPFSRNPRSVLAGCEVCSKRSRSQADISRAG